MASAQSSVPIRRTTPERESTRITLARVLELGVRVTWREAAAIVHEAIAASRGADRTGPARVTAESCLLTRGGEVMLTGSAVQARPEVVVRLLDDLLAACSEPGRFAGAVADGTALEMIAELSQAISPKRRRVEVASVALRGLVAAADAARALADAAEQQPSARAGSRPALPAPVASPQPGRRPWPPAAGSREAIPAIPGQVDAPRRAAAVPAAVPTPPPRPAATFPAAATTAPPRRSAPSPVAAPPASPRGHAVTSSGDDRVPRARLLALACLVVAVAAGGAVLLRTPAIQPPAVAPPVAVIDPPTPPTLTGQRPDPAIPAPPDDAPATSDDPPPVFGEVESIRELRRPPDREPPYAPADRPQPAPVPSPPPPASRSETPDASPGTIAPSDSLPAPPVRTAPPVPASVVTADPRGAARAPEAAVERPAVAASPSVPPAGTAETAAVAPADRPPTPPSSGGAAAETRAIENVLGRYRSAFNALDAGAASAVWPTVNEKNLARAFERLESHAVSFEHCEIEVAAARAEAACSGRARYVPKVGSRTPKDEARQWRFSLRKSGDGWLIDRVEAR
jgi:hypothetical protein